MVSYALSQAAQMLRRRARTGPLEGLDGISTAAIRRLSRPSGDQRDLVHPVLIPVNYPCNVLTLYIFSPTVSGKTETQSFQRPPPPSSLLKKIIKSVS